MLAYRHPRQDPLRFTYRVLLQANPRPRILFLFPKVTRGRALYNRGQGL